MKKSGSVVGALVMVIAGVLLFVYPASSLTAGVRLLGFAVLLFEFVQQFLVGFHHRIRVLQFLLPREGAQFLRVVDGLESSEHLADQPCEPSGGLPLWPCPFPHAVDEALHLPPLHAVEEVGGVYAALADEDLVQVKGGYAFFGSPSAFLPFLAFLTCSFWGAVGRK